MSIHAIIAVRGGEATKSRCSGVLAASERNELVSAMLIDMIATLGASIVDQVHVVTPSPELADLARSRGARIVLEPEARGLNIAFETVRGAIRRTTPDAIIMALPGDMPLIEAPDIGTAIAGHEPGAVVLVPADNDGGTAAVVLRADAPFAFRYGPDSFRSHQTEAAAAGLTPILVRAASLGLDIDRPDDLDQVLQRSSGGHTARLLGRLRCLTEPM